MTEKRNMIGSVYENEQELLKAIIKVHLPFGIECDPMFFKGNFYKEIEKPKYIFDINPIVEECVKGDATNLSFKDNSLNSIILDPPFMFDVGGKSNKYYSSRTHGLYKSFEDMLFSYKRLLVEAYRVLKGGGILVFKCQDYRNVSTHSIIRNMALEVGFREKDIVILNNKKNKVWNSNLKQRIFRKTHSYFWIFIKRGNSP